MVGFDDGDVVAEDATLKDAASAIEQRRRSNAVIVNTGGKLVGTISYGDVRRALLRGLSTESTARDIVNATPVTARAGASGEDKHFNMTQLIEDGMAAGRKIVAFPMFELWKDVGTLQQSDEARKLVELGEISNV